MRIAGRALRRLPTLAALVAVLVAALVSVAAEPSGQAALPGPVPVDALPHTAFFTMVKALGKDVAAAWPRTTEIWPRVDYRPMVLVVTKGAEAAAVTVDGIAPITPAEVRRWKVGAGGTFRTMDWNGHPTISVDAATAHYKNELETARALFFLASHELFHAYVQGGSRNIKPWPVLVGDIVDPGSRDTDFPLKAEPRYFRGMAYNELLKAYRGTSGERRAHLGAAAYWAGRWEREYGDEKRRLTVVDIIEGTADYFAQMATTLAAGRSDRSADMTYADGLSMAAGEAYPLGKAAGLVADQRGIDWKTSMGDQGRTPLSYALTGVVPKRGPDDPALKDSIDIEVVLANEALGTRISDAVAEFDRPALLVLRSSDADAAFTTTGFYRTASLPYSIALRTSTEFGTLTISNRSVLIARVDGELRFVIPFDPEKLLHGNVVRFSEPGLAGWVTVDPGPPLSGKKTYVMRDK
ncbi:hypothetical protein J5X84_16060 [Streptosporangiaceae bacterium NEAU-GS5]|nr:hypothetical protein [Streptosporangiaceae bacterium NEAU-GS5]